MPFVRFSRDRRGYEHTFLVHESAGRGRPSRARVLYWFRTPPGIKVGREAFDHEARRKIESQNPGIAFDWPAIVSTPMPPIPEVEHWRERRRAERAAKVARREEQVDAETESEPTDVESALKAVPPSSLEVAAAIVLVDPSDGSVAPPESREVAAEPDASLPLESDNQARKRRRRRGGRRRRAPGDPNPGSAPEISGSPLEEGADETGDGPGEADADPDLREAVLPPEPPDPSISTRVPSKTSPDASEE